MVDDEETCMKVAQAILAKYQSPGVKVYELDALAEEICEAHGTSLKTWEKSCRKHTRNLDLLGLNRSIGVQKAKLAGAHLVKAVDVTFGVSAIASALPKISFGGGSSSSSASAPAAPPPDTRPMTRPQSTSGAPPRPPPAAAAAVPPPAPAPAPAPAVMQMQMAAPMMMAPAMAMAPMAAMVSPDICAAIINEVVNMVSASPGATSALLSAVMMQTCARYGTNEAMVNATCSMHGTMHPMLYMQHQRLQQLQSQLMAAGAMTAAVGMNNAVGAAMGAAVGMNAAMNAAVGMNNAVGTAMGAATGMNAAMGAAAAGMNAALAMQGAMLNAIAPVVVAPAPPPAVAVAVAPPVVSMAIPVSVPVVVPEDTAMLRRKALADLIWSIECARGPSKLHLLSSSLQKFAPWASRECGLILVKTCIGVANMVPAAEALFPTVSDKHCFMDVALAGVPVEHKTQILRAVGLMNAL